MISRRRFIRGTIAVTAGGLAAAAGAASYARWWEPEWLEFVEHDLPIAGLPRELGGCVLAQISDIHTGPQVSPQYLRRSFEALRTQSPDVVVVTGDWITHDGDRGLDRLARLLDSLPTGRLGTFGILGNHDYGDDWRNDQVAEAVSRRADLAGVRMLRNQVAVVRGLSIIGLEDFWCPHFDGARRVLAPAPAPASLVLCHNPDAADSDIWEGYEGWILAGHTHGGQCKPPFLPPPLLPVRNRRYTAGRFDLNGGRRLYINRGLGHLTKVRFNARPEITMHRLRVDESFKAA